MPQWEVEFTDEFGAWWDSLTSDEQESVDFGVGLLMEYGPTLDHPHSSKVQASRHTHMRELRVQHQGRPYSIGESAHVREKPMARKYQELRDRMSPQARARVDARVKQAIADMPLHQLRRAREFTQTMLATAMETSQGEVSKIEQRTDCYISTLRSYVEAMNGELEIVARFPDGQSVKINQFSDLETNRSRS